MPMTRARYRPLPGRTPGLTGRSLVLAILVEAGLVATIHLLGGHGVRAEPSAHSHFQTAVVAADEPAPVDDTIPDEQIEPARRDTLELPDLLEILDPEPTDPREVDDRLTQKEPSAKTATSDWLAKLAPRHKPKPEVVDPEPVEPLVEPTVAKEANDDPKPVEGHNPEPGYPARAIALGHEGWIDLELTIDKAGAVTEVEVLASSCSALLERHAIRVLRKWRFIDGPGKYRPQRIVFRLR